MKTLSKQILLIIILWILLAVDFVMPLTETVHMIFHIIIGAVGTIYIIKKVK